MLPKTKRLNSVQFEIVRQQGKKVYSSIFRGHVLKNQKDTKIGVLIPKKIVKKRHERNSLKRKITHLVKEYGHKNIHLIVILNKRTENYEVLSDSLSCFMQKID